MAIILIADGERTTRELIAEVLEGEGHVAIQSSSGRHAWEILQVNPQINMIITDVMTPEMDGRDLVGAVRGNAEFQHIPIVIMSAVVSAKEVSNLLKIGATLFLQKPIKVEEIKHYVLRILQPA